jgi:hypothetical protein
MARSSIGSPIPNSTQSWKNCTTISVFNDRKALQGAIHTEE